MAVGRASQVNERARLGALLRAARVEAGLRQVDVAERLGQPQSYVSRFELAEQRLDLVELRTVCDALGLSLAELVRRFEEQA